MRQEGQEAGHRNIRHRECRGTESGIEIGKGQFLPSLQDDIADLPSPGAFAVVLRADP